jgi:hypothetical protein
LKYSDLKIVQKVREMNLNISIVGFSSEVVNKNFTVVSYCSGSVNKNITIVSYSSAIVG